MLILATAAVGGCTSAGDGTDLVGVYTIKGVLTENSCGQAALPAPNPLEYSVTIREKDGVGYWVPARSTQNVGSLDAAGRFRFALTQTQVYGMLAPPLDQPGDYFPASNGRNDPDLPGNQIRAQCALTVRQTVSGSLRRRNAADGGGIVELAGDEDASDLSADNVIDVSPSSASNCNDALAAFGGTYLSLPCSARYLMQGGLTVAANEPSGASTPPAAQPGGDGTAGTSGSAAANRGSGGDPR